MKANELKVTDLMVGDWLYITDYPMRKEAKQVKPEHLLRSLVIFEPIPLTPEILKKNGFVNSYIDLSLNKDSVYKYNHFYTGNSVIVDMESNKLIVKYENNIWMNLPYNRTIYVHELQHVLKHCEIKKEIII